MRAAVLAAAVLGLVPLGALEITIQTDRPQQTIEHFGASAAWWAQAVGTWPSSQQDRILDLLFDRQKGIGLTLVRYNVGAGKAPEGSSWAGVSDPWRSAQSPLTAGIDGPLDWSRDAAAVAIIDGAVARGASVLPFFNSPPVQLTTTGKPTGNGWWGNLAADRVPEFGRYVARVTASLQQRWPLVAVSPLNEPQWDWAPSHGQEGIHYSPAQALEVVSAVVNAFSEAGLTVPVSAFDSVDWTMAHNREFVDRLAAVPGLGSHLTPMAVHSYWSTAKDKAELVAYASKKLPGLGLWQTEWTQMEGGRDAGMTSALVLAQVLHEDLTLGGVSSWQYWIAASKYDWKDGLVAVDEGTSTVTTTKRLWALGNWSRFVLPGAVRLEVSGTPDGVLASAFRNPDGELVLVLVNPKDTVAPRFSLAVFGTTTPVWSGRWVTSDDGNLAQQTPGSFATVDLPGRSITTFTATVAPPTRSEIID